MKNKTFSRNNLAFNIISDVLFLIIIFSIIVSLIGYNTFTDNMNMIYGDKANEVAFEAMTKINAEHIKRYLENGESDEEWQECNNQLQALCNNMGVTMIYVIRVDTSDYSGFTTVFHVIGKDDDAHKAASLGQKSEILSDSFKREFELLYNDRSLESSTLLGANELHGDRPYITAVHPVLDKNGAAEALVCVQLPMTNLNYRITFLVRIAVSAAFLIVLAIIVFARYIRKHIVIPVRKVSDETMRFSKENKKGEALGNISKINEISSLSHSIDKMEDEMIEYIENLTAVTAEKERIGAELSIAAKIQKGAVPNTFPAFKNRKDFDIYASMTPAKEVGGDFYNYFLTDDDHLALVIADVSGKGVPAALFMMVTNTIIRDRTRMGGTPAEILEYVNDTVCESNETGMFVTVWLGILELSTGKMTACNAGHDSPALYRKGKGFDFVEADHGVAIGAMSGMPYDDYEFKLEKGDKLFLYTDGIPESANEAGEMLRLSKMIDILNENKEKSPREILAGVESSVKEFVGNAPQFDDLTMLCLKLSDDGDTE